MVFVFPEPLVASVMPFQPDGKTKVFQSMQNRLSIPLFFLLGKPAIQMALSLFNFSMWHFFKNKENSHFFAQNITLSEYLTRIL